METINGFSSRYIDSSEFIRIESVYVFNGVLESNLKSLDMLLDVALLDIDNNSGYNNNRGLVDLFFRRYHEMIEMIPHDIYLKDNDYYTLIFTKIQQLDELLH